MLKQRAMSQPRRVSSVNSRASNTDRLKQLSLPNSHLVEAVLKEHYGIFNDECKTRLKKLLEIIVHNGAERKSEKVLDTTKVKCITNLRSRINSIQTDENKRREAEWYNRQRNNNPGGDQPRKKDSREMQVIYRSDDGRTKSQTTVPTEGGDCNTDCGECNTTIGEYQTESGDGNTHFVDNNSTVESYKSALELHRDKTHFACNRQQGMWMYNANEEDNALRSRVPNMARDLPTLVIRYYIVLILDMKKNCRMYEVFIKHAVKPTEAYKMQYFESGYNLWMDYLEYIKITLDTLHPYILHTIKMCNIYEPGDLRLRQIETKIPSTLVAALRGMKSWRKSLRDTIKCCRDLLAENGRQRTAAVNAHRLYVRYHDKLPTVSQLNLEVEELLLER